MNAVPMHNQSVRFRRVNGRIVPIKMQRNNPNGSQAAVNTYDYAKGAAAGAAFALGSKYLKQKKFVYAFAGLTGLTVAVRAHNSRNPQEFAENFTTGLLKKGVGFAGAAGAFYGGSKLMKLARGLK